MTLVLEFLGKETPLLGSLAWSCWYSSYHLGRACLRRNSTPRKAELRHTHTPKVLMTS